MKYLSFVLGIIAFLFYIISLQCKHKKDILSLQTLANIFYASQYFILNALSGAYTAILATIRSLIYYFYEKKNKNIPLILPIIFIIILLIISYISYTGLNTLLPIVINTLLIIFTYTKNLKYLRINSLVCAILWIIYNINVQAYGVLLGNIFEILSVIIALKRFEGEKYD